MKTNEDIKQCEDIINRLQQLGIPISTIKKLRQWLKKEKSLTNRNLSGGD